MVQKATLTVAETATLLGLNRKTVYAMCGKGHLQSIRFGRAIRIPRSALQIFLSPNERAGSNK